MIALVVVLVGVLLGVVWWILRPSEEEQFKAFQRELERRHHDWK